MSRNNASPKTPARAPGGGRKRAFDPDETLARAMDVFWEHGFANTTVRQLETELGLTASSIYNAFGSKSALLDAAIEQYVSILDRVVLAELRTAPDPLKGLQDFFDHIAQGVDGEHRWGCFVVSLLAENAGKDSRISKHTDRYFTTVHQDLTATLQRAEEAGLINPALSGKDPNDWVAIQSDLLLANVLGINTAARGRMAGSVIESMTRSVQLQIESWRTS